MALDNTSIIDSLRNVRGADDIIERLKSNSLEARRDRIAEALKSPDWKDPVTGASIGPAKLEATYPKHVLASKDGVLMRVALDEDENSIKFGRVEIYDLPVPASDIGAEIMETARVAVDAILSEDLNEAKPMVASIARALDIKGTLQTQIESEVRLRALTRKAWWDGVVSENYEGDEVGIPQPREVSEGGDVKAALAGSVDDLLGLIKNEAAETLRAIQKLDERKDVPAIYVECARDISEDIKTAISALANVNRESQEDLKHVYETVGLVAPRLIKGSKFLVALANNS